MELELELVSLGREAKTEFSSRIIHRTTMVSAPTLASATKLPCLCTIGQDACALAIRPSGTDARPRDGPA